MPGPQLPPHGPAPTGPIPIKWGPGGKYIPSPLHEGGGTAPKYTPGGSVQTQGTPYGGPPRPDDFRINPQTGALDPNSPINWPAYAEAYDAWLFISTGGEGGTGGTGAGAAGPQDTPADYINAIIGGIQADIDNRRLQTTQVVEEFNRRFQALQNAGTQFQGIQPYTIPTGAGYVPGYEPGGFGQSVGLQPVASTPINYNPFEQANALVQGTPEVTSVGGANTQQAIDIAKKFLGM